MRRPKCQAEDYLQFLIASPRQFTCTEAARVQPPQPLPPTHDAFHRLLLRLEPDAPTLWQEARAQVQLRQGVLVIDDTTLDKPYARHMNLVRRHWSGKHHAVVHGINLVTLLWTDGDRPIPCDYRVFTHDGQTKQDHFRALVTAARERGFQPHCVAFDGWYASLDNLKLLRSFGWRWLTRLKSNRLVNVERQGAQALGTAAISAQGTIVYLQGYGLVKVFRIVTPDGDTAHWATNDLTLDDGQRLAFAEWSWKIEEYHRGIKQFCGAERCQACSATIQRNHLTLVLRAFLRLEYHAFHQGISWFEAKTRLVREAVRSYLAKPLYTLPLIA